MAELIELKDVEERVILIGVETRAGNEAAASLDELERSEERRVGKEC